MGVGVPEGVGEGVAEAGSAWQFVLAEVGVLLVTASNLSAPARSPPARAEPGKLASMPAMSRAPASTLTAATRRGAKRMRIALSTLLIQVVLLKVRKRAGDGWALVLISDDGQVCMIRVFAPWPGRRGGMAI